MTFPLPGIGQVSGMVKRALASGAEALVGGKVNGAIEKGYHFEPTLLVQCL